MSLSSNQNRFKAAIIILAVALLAIIALALFTLNKKTATQNPQKPVQPDEFIPPKQSRPQLPAKSQTIRQKLIEGAVEKNGDKVVFSSGDFVITYVPTLDMFFVQILKDPAQKIKEDAQNWFLDQGLTQKELCNLPLRTLLFNPDLKKTNPNFDLFPTGCK